MTLSSSFWTGEVSVPQRDVLIPERPNRDVLDSVAVVGVTLRHFILTITQDVKNTCTHLFLHGDGNKEAFHMEEVNNFDFDEPVSIEGITGSDRFDNIFVKYSTLTSPGKTLTYSLATHTWKLFREAVCPEFWCLSLMRKWLTTIEELSLSFSFSPYFSFFLSVLSFMQPIQGVNSSIFKSEQTFYRSKDGTRIPMFLIHASARDNGDDSFIAPSPCLLYGYGGFNISLLPFFSGARLAFLQHCAERSPSRHAVYAIANIRGGGEYGEEWHKSAVKEKRQNSFDDFQSAAEFLTAELKITTSDRLCIHGGSNGGLLVAACAIQRPDLFGCILCDVGVLDMIRSAVDQYDEFSALNLR